MHWRNRRRVRRRTSGRSFVYNPRFPGQYYDAETGLSYNYFRDYDPATGRYVESDPAGIAASINTYTYVDSDPLLFFDPDGRGKEGGQKSIAGNDPAMPRDGAELRCRTLTYDLRTALRRSRMRRKD
jgi:RHS repeat-associated protein